MEQLPVDSQCPSFILSTRLLLLIMRRSPLMDATVGPAVGALLGAALGAPVGASVVGAALGANVVGANVDGARVGVLVSSSVSSRALCVSIRDSINCTRSKSWLMSTPST